MVEDEELQGLLEPDEIARIEKIASSFTALLLEEALADLAKREIGLLRDARFSDDPVMRELTLMNIAALVAAAALVEEDLSPGQTGTPDTGSGPDGRGPPRPPG